MLKVSQTPNELKTFIATAERAWFNVYDSADDRFIVTDAEGTEYKRLPLRFSTRAKVIAYFRRYWGITMSNIMFCNLKSITRNNRLYVIVGDTGTVSFIPRRIRVTNRTSTRIRVTAALSVDENTDEDIQIVRYVISTSGNKLIILDRDKKNTDPRYTKCPVS